MSLQSIGSLFNSVGEMSGARFKGVTSIDDMIGLQSDSFKQLLQLNSDGISSFTMEQIKAKAATLGLTDSLTAQAVALASDADFTAKANTGSLTWNKALKDNSISVEEVGKALKKTGKIADSDWDWIEKASGNEYKARLQGAIDGVDGLGDSFIDLGTTAEKSTSTIGNTFKGLLATAKQILPVVAAIGVAVAAFEAFDYLTHGYTRAVEAAESAATEYSNAQTELKSLNSEYEQQKAQIEELQALKTDGSITMAQEVELSNLKNQNAELERQIELQQSIVDIKQKASADAAVKASNTEQSYMEAMQEEYGSVLGWFAGIAGYAGTYTDENGMTTSVGLEWDKQDTTEEGKIQTYISDLEDYEKQLKDVEDQLMDDPGDEGLLKRQEQLNQNILDTNENLQDSAAMLQNWIDQSTDADGNVAKGFEEDVKAWRDALNDINNIGKSTEEIDLNNLENFFMNNSAIEKYLKNVIENGGSATDALEKFKKLGLSLDSIDVSEEGFIRYFQDVKSSAEEAAEAINSVDGSFEGVQAAFESENQGAEWDAMATNIESALEILKEGRVGTDDFQTVAAWLSPTPIDEDAFKYDAEAYVDAWDKAYKKVKDWFDSENPLDSMWAFADDLEDEGIAKITKTADGGLSEIIPKFKTTAEAAEELGVGVNAVEAAMRKLEEYGFEFDDVMFSGEGIDRYESALENIKSLYDSMDEGSSKDRLGGLIENWDSELEKYQDDLSLLTEDQIVHIEFEYDLASIQQQIDQVMSLINNGDTSVENYAQVLAGNESYIQTAENGIGFDTEGVKIPVEYVANEDTISTLQEQLKSVTNEEDKIAIQAQIVNLQEVQKDLLNAFSTAHPEINADSSIDEINAAWNDFVNTAEGKEIIANIVAQGDEAKQAVADILGIDVDDINIPVKADTSEAEREINGLTSKDGKTITMDVDASTDDIEYALKQLQQDQTLIFTAEVDGKENGVAASFDETGRIVYTAEINGVETTLQQVTDEEGNITYKANYDELIDNLDVEATVDYLIGEQESPETKEAFVDYIKNNQDNPEFREALLDYIRAGQDDPEARTALLDYIKDHQEDADDQDALVNYFIGEQIPPVDDVAGVYYYLTGQEGPVDKVAGVVYKVTSVIGDVANAITGGSGLTGTAHINGSTHGLYPIPKLSGRALAMGTLQDDSWLDPQWRTKRNEVALTGEEGQELVVTRANRWFTVGDRGAEFANIPQGSIIFNAQQTKELLSKGRINSRGTAMIGGTAYATGGYLPNPGTKGWGYGTSGSSKSSSGSSSKSSSTSSTKSVQKAADMAKEAADEFKEVFDEIAIKLDRMDRTLQKLTDSIETYSYDLSKQSAMSDKAMNTIRSNLTTLQSAYKRYIKEADRVGLSDSWKRRVENGAIDVTTLTDEDLADKISKYQEYYEKSLDVQDTIADYQSQLLDLATEKLDNIEQYYENRTNYNDEFGYLTDISTLQDALNKLTAELNKQVLAGVIKEGSNEFYEAMSKISEAQDALIEATLKKYQDIIDNLDRISTTLDNSLTLKEARGDTITESDYQRPLDVANEQIDKLYDKREKLLKQQGIYDVGSVKYDDYADQIADIDDEIYGLLGDIEDLKDKIWEVRWQPFFDGQEAAENLRNEMDGVRDLLDSDAFVDTKGGLTSEGITNLGLISSAMNVEKQRVRDLNEAIVKLSEDLDNGNISTSEYEDQLKDFTDQIYDSAGVVEDYRNSIVDLWEEMITQENEVIQSSIDKHKELLQAKKDNDSYSRNIKDQTKEINQIQAQISALSGVREICPIYFNCWKLLRALYNNITMKYGCM